MNFFILKIWHKFSTQTQTYAKISPFLSKMPIWTGQNNSLNLPFGFLKA